MEELVDAIELAGVRPICMNLFAGDLDAGERGILNDPGRSPEFRAGVATAVELSTRLDCRIFNALYGLVAVGQSEDAERFAVALANLKFACESLGRVGATVVLEPLCRNPRFGLRTPEAVLEVLDELRGSGCTNVGMLADFYQFAGTELDVPAWIRGHCSDIVHVQVADDPGRGAPGTGDLPLLEWLEVLQGCGYEGTIGLEYLPGDEADPFAWIPTWRAIQASRGSGRSGPVEQARDS